MSWRWLVCILRLYLLLVISNLCESQNKSIDFGLNLTLAFKRPIWTGLEAMNRCRRELAPSTIFKSTARNPSRRLLLSLLLLSGNMELNPGPQYKQPCGKCTRPLKSNQKGIKCYMCDVWYHAKCSNVDLKFLPILHSHGYVHNAGFLIFQTHSLTTLLIPWLPQTLLSHYKKLPSQIVRLRTKSAWILITNKNAGRKLLNANWLALP